MRKKIKPDLNLEEIQQSLIDQVVELYASGMSMRNIGTQFVSNLSIFEHFRHPIFAHKSIKKAAEAAVFNI